MHLEYFLKQQLIILSDQVKHPEDLWMYCSEENPTSSLVHWWEGPGKPLLRWVEALESLPLIDSLQLLYYDLDTLKKFFENHFEYVEAAGAIVAIKNQDYFLAIYRRGFWDLPKGKMEKGEDPEECALREVMEETGVKISNNNAIPLTTTKHLFRQQGRWHIKKTHWFVFEVDSALPTKPESREGIKEARWLSLTEWKHRRKRSYLSVCHVVSQFIQRKLSHNEKKPIKYPSIR